MFSSVNTFQPFISFVAMRACMTKPLDKLTLNFCIASISRQKQGSKRVKSNFRKGNILPLEVIKLKLPLNSDEISSMETPFAPRRDAILFLFGDTSKYYTVRATLNYDLFEISIFLAC